ALAGLAAVVAEVPRLGARRCTAAAESAHIPPAADPVGEHRRSRRRSSRPRVARRGIPGPRLLGRAVRLPVLCAAVSRDRTIAAALPVAAAAGGTRRRPRAGFARRDVSLAER